MADTRNTKQRQIIRDVFEDAGRPLSASEVAKLARVEVGNIGTATVYRTINKLLEDGFWCLWKFPQSLRVMKWRDCIIIIIFIAVSAKKSLMWRGAPPIFQRLRPKGIRWMLMK